MTLAQEINLYRQDVYNIPELLDLLDVGLIILDKEARISLWNEWLSRHSTISVEKALGRKLHDVFPETQRGRTLLAVEHALQYGMSSLLSTTFNKMPFPLAKRGKDGETIHEISQLVTIKALPDRDGSYNCLIQIIDVTSAERREQAMRNQAKELQQSNTDLSQFAYVVSHDLQEPLRTIRNFGSLLESDFGKKLTDDGRDYLQRIIKSTNRLQIMVSDVLTYSNASQSQCDHTPVDLNEVLEDVLIEMEIKLKETSATIVVDKLPEIYGDKDQLHQLFQNLIGNSLKFSKTEEAPGIKISTEQLPDKHTAIIELSDNGIGFEQKYADRIFNMSERLHNRKRFPGNGIGLAICHRIVERHNGQIAAFGKPGLGATFKIELPTKQQPLQTEE